MKKQVLLISLLALVIFCAPVQATHIQYFSYADITEASFSDDGDTWSWEFDLTKDYMKLWDIDEATQLADGSYNSDYALHYVTLRIEPNNYASVSTSNDIGLTVNGHTISDWENPIRLYDWGYGGGPTNGYYADDSYVDGELYDPYGIAISDYIITVKLTGFNALPNLAESLEVNLEGCFDDAAPVPEPSTLLLLGTGLVGLAGWRRRKAHQRSR